MKKGIKSIMLVGTMMAGLGLVTAGCGSTTTGTTASSGSTGSGSSSSEPTYTVGTDATYAPFESQVGTDIQGFDIDVLNAVAKAGGFKVQYQNTPWDGIFLALNNGQRDILASAVSITPDRQKSYDFSDPYFDATQMIVFKKGENIKSMNDLKGKKVAVQNATTGDVDVTNLLGKTSPNVKRFESMPLAFMELKNGGVDAAVGDNGVVLQYLKENPNSDWTEVVDPNAEVEHYGFVVKKGNSEVLKKINDGIAKIKADGTLAQIDAKYGFQPMK